MRNIIIRIIAVFIKKKTNLVSARNANGVPWPRREALSSRGPLLFKLYFSTCNAAVTLRGSLKRSSKLFLACINKIKCKMPPLLATQTSKTRPAGDCLSFKRPVYGTPQGHSWKSVIFHPSQHANSKHSLIPHSVAPLRVFVPHANTHS